MAKFKVIIEMEVEASGKLDAGAVAVGKIAQGIYWGKTIEDIGCKLQVKPILRDKKQKQIGDGSPAGGWRGARH